MVEVSVIIPVYESEEVIERCIESVLLQTHENFELILIDDGSTDNSGKICDSYAKKDRRIVVIHKENGGVSSARNAGLDIAKGTYVLFVDSDDYLSETYIEHLYKNRSDLTICGMDARDERGGELYTIIATPMHFEQRKDINYPLLYQQNVMYSPYCKLFRSEIIQRYNLRFPLGVSWGEDGMFVAGYLQFVDSLAVIQQSGYNYIKYDGESTLSTKVRDNIIDTIVMSREYCVHKMQSTSPEQEAEVRRICQEDIRHNCAYFVASLLENAKVEKQEKIRLLERFMENSYVMDTLRNPGVYYSRCPDIAPFLNKQKAGDIVHAIHSFQLRHRIKMTILYRFQPITKIYTRIKQVVRK